MFDTDINIIVSTRTYDIYNDFELQRSNSNRACQNNQQIWNNKLQEADPLVNAH